MLGGVLFVIIRGGITESTSNVGQVYFSNDQFLNHSAVNPIFSFLYSLGKMQDFSETYNYFELNELIELQKMRGDANVKYSLIQKNNRFALPFSAFILTIMGVALSSKKRRGGIGWNIGLGIALAFTYILFLKFSEMFVHAGVLPPFIALWMPNIVFAFIAAFLYRIAPK